MESMDRSRRKDSYRCPRKQVRTTSNPKGEIAFVENSLGLIFRKPVCGPKNLYSSEMQSLCSYLYKSLGHCVAAQIGFNVHELHGGSLSLRLFKAPEQFLTLFFKVHIVLAYRSVEIRTSQSRLQLPYYGSHGTTCSCCDQLYYKIYQYHKLMTQIFTDVFM